MKTDEKCKLCVVDQARRAANVLKLNNTQKEAIVKLANLHIDKFEANFPPPVNAYKFYEEVAEYLGCSDIYKDFKKASSEKAKEFEGVCEEEIKKADNPLLIAAKIAVAGNVIDLASSMQYDLKEELEKILDNPFEIDDFESLNASLKEAKNIVYLADNVGEEVFDKLYIKTIKNILPNTTIYYFTRGKPIINDITYEEALEFGLDEAAKVINSGVPTPGFVMELADKNAFEIFEKADIIISKGMGNYECLSEKEGFNIFYLLKVKCEVVGRHIGAKLGSLVCKKA
jgi:uncharacterized protein with ATP-grasp and redox domains